MNEQRHRWIEQMVRRDNRILDVNINASLQNGTAFFASASLIALGAALTLLRSTDDALHLLSEMPFGLPSTRLAWELKVLGLTVIFGYAFYKFAWSYRLFNYAAILIGAVVPHDDPALGPAEARRAANMNVTAGRHFTRGLQAFFFALAYLVVHRSVGPDRLHGPRSGHRVAPPVCVRRTRCPVQCGTICAKQKETRPCRTIDPSGRRRAAPCQASVSISNVEETRSAPRANG